MSVGFIDADTDPDPDADGPLSRIRIALSISRGLLSFGLLCGSVHHRESAWWRHDKPRLVMRDGAKIEQDGQGMVTGVW